MAGMAGVSRVTAASPPVVDVVEVIDQLVCDLALGFHRLLQVHDLVDEHLVGVC